MVYPCYYLAPVSYYSLIAKNNEAITIEHHDNYERQTYRNRCRIYGANGVINLVIPIIKNHSKKTLTKDVLIDYDTAWNRTHWKSIQAAYTSAPYYEYVIDSFARFYENKFKYLADFNIQILKETLELLQINTPFEFTKAFERPQINENLFLSIHPKKEFVHKDYNFKAAWYQQVFSDRHGHKKDLSIMDLLMNEGSDARSILLKSF